MQLTVPHEGRQGGELIVTMTTPSETSRHGLTRGRGDAATGRRGAGPHRARHAARGLGAGLPPGPRHLHPVGPADRGLRLLGSPYFFTLDNALLIAQRRRPHGASSRPASGIGVMTGVLDLSLPGTAAIASCVCGWLLTHGYATWLVLRGRPGLRRRRRPGQRLHHAARLQPDHRHHRHAVGADRSGGGRGGRLHVPGADPARVHGHPPLLPDR